jgi:hypothetical protein
VLACPNDREIAKPDVKSNAANVLVSSSRPGTDATPRLKSVQVARNFVLPPLVDGNIQKKSEHMASSFYTIGYEGSRVDEFVATLRRTGVETLIDIRDVPFSRKPGFSKSALAENLEANGIAYVHLKVLGDPRPGREAARAGKHALFRQIFGRHMATDAAQRDLERAVELMRSKPCCLMCFEQDHCNCHRSIVAGHIVEHTGLRLKHLLVGGESAVHEPVPYLPGLAVA